jgi:O-succinylbenzoic acid--CoA ligase
MAPLAAAAGEAGAAPERRRLSWRELCARVDALAAGFRAGRSRRRGRAAAGYNQPDLLAWLALLQCGARVLPLNPQLPAPLLAELPSLGLRALVLNGGDLPVALNPLALHAGDGVHAVPGEKIVASMTLTSGRRAAESGGARFRAHLASAEGVLAMMPFAAGRLAAVAAAVSRFRPGDSLALAAAGAGLTVRDKQPLEQALRGCTHASLVPTQLWRLLNGDAEVSLKAVLLGGAAIPVALTEQAGKRGIRCWCGYGSPSLPPRYAPKRRTAWRMSGSRCRGAKCGLSMAKSGCGPTAWPQATGAMGKWSPSNADGWFATRDRGRLEHGRLTILGRWTTSF